MATGGIGNRPNPSLADRGDLCGPSGSGKPWRAVVFVRQAWRVTWRCKSSGDLGDRNP